MVYTNIVMLTALIVIHTLLIAENAMVIVKQCWWLQPPAVAMALIQFFVSSCTNIVRPHVCIYHAILGLAHI